MFFRKSLAVVAVVAALAACSHSNQNTGNGITSTNAPASAGNTAEPPAGGMNANGEAMAPGTLATVPPNLNCGTAAPVWTNPRTHTYHTPTDPYYGRTRHGQYMCVADALKAGYRLAKPGHHRHHGGAMTDGQPSPMSS